MKNLEMIADDLFCGCSDAAVRDVLTHLNKHKRNELPFGILDLLNALDDDYNVIELSQIGNDGLYLIEYCVDYLFFQYNDMIIIPKKEIHGNKYITLYSFIYDFLNIKDVGYQFWLMNLLDWYDIIEHGSSIRCARFNWSHRNPYHDRVLSFEREEEINNWGLNAPDDI